MSDNTTELDFGTTAQKTTDAVIFRNCEQPSKA